MDLKKGKSDKVIRENIEQLRKAGYKPTQAVETAMRAAGVEGDMGPKYKKKGK